jgi:serine/threonine-protein kinase
MEAVAIPGTEGGSDPFFSPDGHWVGFFSNGKLLKIDLRGGLSIPVCDASDEGGGSWGEDGTILYASTGTSGLSRVPASGGTAALVTRPDAGHGELSHRYPEFLPGRKAALFTILRNPVRDSQIALLLLETGEHRVLLEGGYNPRFSPSGHIVYERDGQLMAVAFDLGTLALSGERIPILEGVARELFSVSRDGSLAYVPAGPVESTLMWVDRKGKSRALTEGRRSFYFGPRFSPDGTRLAVSVATGGKDSIWVYDLERDAMNRLSSGNAGDHFPVWSPDGARIAYVSGGDIVWQAADGSAGAETLLRGAFQNNFSLGSWSPDGSLLAFSRSGDALSDIWLLSLEGDRRARPFLQTQADERGPVFSPDGRWIAYVSNESGRYEVYVRSYPGPGGKSQVSTEGGIQPAWARSGREIFYRNGEKTMAVAVDAGKALRLSKATLLFEGQFVGASNAHTYNVLGRATYDVAPDGEHLVMLQEGEFPRIHIVLNWSDELKGKVIPDRR